MAIKKSELYSSLWQSCDELRGGMDASQYKDYVLVLLFIKYISDKYLGLAFAPVTIPEGASFKDMVALKGKPSIGDDINKKIIAPLRDAKGNNLFSMPDFNDPEKLGSGKDMVDRLSNLIAIFEKPALDFSKNRADGDDILGDAYEYLMRHFATESGKSKGQFYTPAEVSRVMAKILDIPKNINHSDIAIYDPTCGSGSLLLKVGEEAGGKAALFGQEKDAATSGLARMNMILHDTPTAEIKQGNTLANPLFLDNGHLQTFDYVVANPPFSDKRWSNGVSVDNDPFNRFDNYGVPPDKNGDYAYLLHIIRSLKSRGKGACILPHGVLFRGNAESLIRQTLIQKGLIKGIIGLPANLFYGTGIPACIIVIDKENAATRNSLFMIDASKGFMKDGNKNRLRDMDIHKIIDVFNKNIELTGYSRLVTVAEIESNDFNLNIPRYIDNSEAEDLQDLTAHLHGGIPQRDIDALHAYWQVFPNLKTALFTQNKRADYFNLQVGKETIKTTIYTHPEFTRFIARMNQVFTDWCNQTTPALKALEPNFHPKEFIHDLSENLLATYTDKQLLNKYDVYQHLMNFWAEVMQDDCYLISADDWKADTYRIIEEKKNKDNQVVKRIDKGWACDLIPKNLVINRYFAEQQQAINQQQSALESMQSQLQELEEEYSGEGDTAFFSELDKISKATVSARLKDIKHDTGATQEQQVLNQYLALLQQESELKKAIKDAENALDAKVLAFYPTLSTEQIKQLVVDDKWMNALDTAIHGEMNRISQQLTQRIKELAERYETPLPQLTEQVSALSAKVADHLKTMGILL